MIVPEKMSLSDFVSRRMHPVKVTISLGVASSVFADASDSLIRAADAALYRAKRSGRNRVECAGAADYLDEVPVVNQHNGG